MILCTGCYVESKRTLVNLTKTSLKVDRCVQVWINQRKSKWQKKNCRRLESSPSNRQKTHVLMRSYDASWKEWIPISRSPQLTFSPNIKKDEWQKKLWPVLHKAQSPCRALSTNWWKPMWATLSHHDAKRTVLIAEVILPLRSGKQLQHVRIIAAVRNMKNSSSYSGRRDHPNHFLWPYSANSDAQKMESQFSS